MPKFNRNTTFEQLLLIFLINSIIFAVINGKSISSTFSTTTPTPLHHIPSDPKAAKPLDGPFRLISLAVPDKEQAVKLARELLNEHLAATVNVFQSAVSLYIWNGTLREVPEIVMFVFTHVNQYGRFEKYVREHHIHIEPGLVSIPIVGGSETFLRWMEGQTKMQEKTSVDESKTSLVEVVPPVRKNNNNGTNGEPAKS